MRLAHDEIKNLGSIKIQYPIAVSSGLKDMTKPKTYPKFIFKIDGFKTRPNQVDKSLNQSSLKWPINSEQT